MNWLTDKDGNKCSVEYWGSTEAAQKALDSLKEKNCNNCTNCYDCSGCYDCYDCSGCSSCSRLKGASPVESKETELHPIPKIENIHQKVLAAVSSKDALDMSDWHTCDTTHCRAGWVVHLAGEAGYALEKFHNTALAAQLIYRESGHPINPCRFYDSNEKTMEDIKKCAGV